MPETLNPVALNAQLLERCRAADFAGYDPYDGLNSRLFQSSGLQHFEWTRLAWIQLHKRSPINLRGLCGVPKRRNPKGIALFILGLIQDWERTREPGYLQQACGLADWLLTQQSDVRIWKHSCWGYHFDWQAKAFYVPAGKPNVVTTWYVSYALWQLAASTGEPRYREALLSAARFVREHLLSGPAHQRYFAYIPGETALVHNASLWGAALVAIAGRELADASLLELAAEVAGLTVSQQEADGGWRYGQLPHHRFRDGFHTGFNLEALDLIRKATASPAYDFAISRGLECYRQRFFDDDGTARYYDAARYPLDMHSVAEALIVFSRIGDQNDRLFAGKVLHTGIDQLYLPALKRFAYQRHRWWSTNIDYARWTQAWAYYGIATYNRFA